MKIKNIFMLIMILISVSSWALSSEDASKQAVSAFEKAVSARSVAGVGNIVYGEKKIGSSYSLYLQELISGELQKSESFELSDRGNLDDIMKEVKLALSGMTDSDTSIDIGMLKGLEYIVTGKFFDNGTNIKLFLDLVKSDTGVSVSKMQYVISKSTLPTGVELLPENYSDAMYVLEELSSLTKSSGKGLDVRAWNVRGDGGIYRDGEELQVNFFANRDCFIKVYHIDVNKKASLIFPNPYYSDNHIKGKQIVKIPDSRYPFKFKLTSPYGSEFIKVIASTTQFKDIEDSFKELGTASGELLTRGLVVEAKETLTDEALFSYTILK